MTAPTATQPSLLPEQPPVTQTTLVDVGELPPDSDLIGPDPDGRFIDSVRLFGILTPIQVTVMPGTHRLVVTDGRRRLKAARAAGLLEVPATLISGDGMSIPAVTLLANARRSANEASDYQAITDLLTEGYNESAIAVATGLPIQTIRKRLKLTRLIPDLLALFLNGDLHISVAERATALDAEQQEDMARLYTENGRLTMRDVIGAQRVKREAAVATLPADLFAGPDLEDAPAPPSIRDTHPELAALLGEMVARFRATGHEPTVAMVRRLMALLPEEG